MKNKKVIGIVIAAVLVVAFGLVYMNFGPKATEGSKNVTIEVVDPKGDETKYEFKTDAEFLKEAFEDAKDLDVDGDEGQYGMVIYAVNGHETDFDKDGSYWSIVVNGEYGQYGAESQPVNDGDEFQLVYTKQ